VPPTLARTLHSTNPIESMIEICREHSKNVKRWRDGTMALRWCAAGILEAGHQGPGSKYPSGSGRARSAQPSAVRVVAWLIAVIPPEAGMGAYLGDASAAPLLAEEVTAPR